MVYKNIYQVAEKPISEEDYITSDSFLNHSFIGKVADCVKIAANRNYEIEMLAEWLESNRLGKIKGKTLTLSGYMLLSNYFYENFKGFKQTIKALDAWNITRHAPLPYSGLKRTSDSRLCGNQS